MARKSSRSSANNGNQSSKKLDARSDKLPITNDAKLPDGSTGNQPTGSSDAQADKLAISQANDPPNAQPTLDGKSLPPMVEHSLKLAAGDEAKTQPKTAASPSNADSLKARARTMGTGASEHRILLRLDARACRSPR